MFFFLTVVPSAGLPIDRSTIGKLAGALEAIEGAVDFFELPLVTTARKMIRATHVAA
jgi:hypothetical protein